MYNDSNLEITMCNMSSINENRSIFGKKVSYSNLSITIVNDFTMRWSSDYTGFSFV